MKKILQDLASFPRTFAIFLAVITLLSSIGGYQLSRLFYRMNDTSLQRADQLLVIEESLDQAAIALGGQIQEWKDMLLRATDEQLYHKHRKAFMDSSVSVQFALMRTKTAMQNAGLDAEVIDQLSAEHKELVANYLLAQARLDRHNIESPHEVDKRVIGVDRSLQQHLVSVKTDIEQLAQQHLNGTAQGSRYWLIGLLGTSSLLIMALLGFVFASRFHDYATAEQI